MVPMVSKISVVYSLERFVEAPELLTTRCTMGKAVMAIEFR